MAKDMTLRPSSDARDFVREGTASMAFASNGTADSCNLAAQTANRVFVIDQPTLVPTIIVDVLLDAQGGVVTTHAS